jgi:hypothetical protein
MTDQEIDVDALRTELDQIKDAMGIQERYESATSVWLLFGIAVPLAAACSQYVHLQELPQWYHSIIWLVVLGGGYGLFLAFADEGQRWTRSTFEGKPNLWLQFGIVYLAAIPLQTIVVEYTGEMAYAAESSMALSIIVVMLGVAYGVFGSSLRAFYVRERDRWVFYAGAIWMVALGVAIPQSTALETWGYAVYGGCYLVYAIAAYFVIRAGGDG